MAAAASVTQKNFKIEYKPWTPEDAKRFAEGVFSGKAIVRICPEHEGIGSVFGKIIDALQKGEHERALPFFKELGVFPEDTEALQTFSALLPEIDAEDLECAPMENSGAYCLKRGSKEIAVFKIGRKRASMEIMARFLARELGLQRHMVPVMFDAMINPDFDPENETFEELWNGKHKIFEEPSDDASSGGFETTTLGVVGVVQPFLTQQPKASLLDFTRMTMFALAIGLRDGKQDSFEGATLFDVEDCMPVRIDPIWTPEHINKTPSALELSFLDNDERAKQQLTSEDVGSLAALVQQWNIATILQNIGRLKIQFADQSAEKMKVGARGTDDGRCPVLIQEPYIAHLINGNLSHLTDENPERLVLLPRQLDACNTRLKRIHDFILDKAFKQTTFTPQELAHAVDPWGKIYTDSIQQSSKLPWKLGSEVFSRGINTVTGRRSPEEVEFPITFKDANLHPAAVVLRKSQGVPEEEPSPPPKPSPQED